MENSMSLSYVAAVDFAESRYRTLASEDAYRPALIIRHHYALALAMIALSQLFDQAQCLAFRISSYAMLNFMDDPALLAIVFC